MVKMAERTCQLCNKPFSVKESQLRHGRGKYCSVNCKGKVGRSLQDTRGKKNPNWKGGVWKKNTLIKAAEWNKNNPEKRKVHHLVEREVKRGNITPAPCVKCNAIKAEAHHKDYGLPFNITWLCRSCHLKEHSKLSERPARTGPIKE